ncbi:hypothetical protein ACQP2X_09035 [Actinoplanes sp. CA-131856]
MFPYSDPHIQLDLHHQRVASLIDQASERRRARAARPRRRWRKAAAP